MITCCKDWVNLAKGVVKKHPYWAGVAVLVIVLIIIF